MTVSVEQTKVVVGVVATVAIVVVNLQQVFFHEQKSTGMALALLSFEQGGDTFWQNRVTSETRCPVESVAIEG